MRLVRVTGDAIREDSSPKNLLHWWRIPHLRSTGVDPPNCDTEMLVWAMGIAKFRVAGRDPSVLLPSYTMLSDVESTTDTWSLLESSSVFYLEVPAIVGVLLMQSTLHTSNLL